MESDVRRRAAAPPKVVCLDLQRFATGDPGKPLGPDGPKRRGAASGKTQRSTVTTLPRPRAGRGRPAAKVTHSAETGGSKIKTPARRVPPCVDSELSSRTAKYVVQPGDTLHKVARHFNSTSQELAMLNHLHKPAILFPGDVLLVPDHKG